MVRILPGAPLASLTHCVTTRTPGAAAGAYWLPARARQAHPGIPHASRRHAKKAQETSSPFSSTARIPPGSQPPRGMGSPSARAAAAAALGVTETQLLSEEAALRARVRELRLSRLAQEQVTRKVALSKEGAQIRAEIARLRAHIMSGQKAGGGAARSARLGEEATPEEDR